MNKWTVIWRASDVDDYEYSYVEADEPQSIFDNIELDVVQSYLKHTAQNSNTPFDAVCNVICVLEGHIGVNFP